MASVEASPGAAREFASFAAVGIVGFAIDAGVFLLLNGAFLWPIAGARVVSASCSIATTWALNRVLTFPHRKSPGRRAELLRYAFVQAGGLVVNLAVFSLALWLSPELRAQPIVALALGAGAALAFNFVSARTLAFRGSRVSVPR